MPTPANRKISISVSLDSYQVERLDEISERTKIPRSVLIREGVQNIIEKYEEQLKHSFQPINQQPIIPKSKEEE